MQQCSKFRETDLGRKGYVDEKKSQNITKYRIASGMGPNGRQVFLPLPPRVTFRVKAVQKSAEVSM